MKKLLRFVVSVPFVLLVLWLAPGAACSQSFATPKRISPSAAMGAHAPYLVVERDGSLDVAWFQSNADIWFARSVDHGATWSAAVQVSKQKTTNQYTSLLQRVPHFAADSKGTLHMTWTEDRINKQSDVFYAQSTDHGATWSPAVSIMDANDSMKYSQDFSSLAIDSNDNIYIAFLDNRELMRKTWTNYQLYVIRSTNGGMSWGNPTQATNLPGNKGGTCECCTLEIVAGKDNHVYVAFRSNISDRRDIWISRSRDGAKTWDKAVLAQQGIWTLPACPTTGPSIVLDANENAIVTWRDSRQSVGRDICYTTVLPYGDTTCLPFNIPISRTTNQDANWPSIVLARGNTLGIMYQANSSGTNQLRWTASTDGGTNWSSDLPVDNTSTADQEEVIVRADDQGIAHAVWQDMRGGSNSIYYSHAVLPAVAAPALPILLGPTVPIVTDGSGVKFKWMAPSSNNYASLYWYDITVTGPQSFSAEHLVQLSKIFPITNPGSYYWKVIAHSVIGSDSASAVTTITMAGVEEKSQLSSLRIFPNPSEGRIITIDGIAIGEARSIRVFDALGRECYARPLGVEKSTEINLSALEAGAYFVRIVDAQGNTIEQKRLVLE